MPNPKLIAMFKPIFLLCLLLSAFGIRSGQGQEITLDRDGAPLSDLFVQIHDQTGYFFYYANDDLAEARPVSIHVRKASLEKVLAICFADQPLAYRIDNKTIVVQKKPAGNPSVIDAKGKVLSEQGEPLEDVSVELVATHRAVATDREGEFNIEKVPEGSVLVFSHVGYQAETRTLGKSPNLTVILRRSISKLDEVQVIAYGTTTRRLSTGNVGSLTHETIEQQPVSNPLQALEGRISGVYISQQTGMPGGAMNIQIRGQNSLRADGNYPFYVVDGVPYTASPISSPYTSNSTLGGNPLNEINPADIERIDILKDADATAIFGSRGANGVVLITTKKGKSEKMRVTLNGSTGLGQVAKKMKLLNTSQYLEMRHEAFSNDGAMPGPYDFDMNSWDTSRYTDWQNELLGGSAKVSDFHATVSGGSERAQYLFSGAFQDQGTVFPSDLSDKKTSFHFSVNTESENKRFHIALTGSYLSDNNKLSNYDLTALALTAIPDAPSIYDSRGKLNWTGYFDNPYSYLLKTYNSLSSNLLGNLQASYDLGSGLKFTVSAGANELRADESTANPGSSSNPAFGTLPGSAVFAGNHLRSWILEPQLSWMHNLGSFQITVLAGATFQENTTTAQAIYAGGYANDALLGTPAGSGRIILMNSVSALYHYEAIFGRISGQWKEKLLLNLTGRRDGSSRFGPDRQFGNFGSLGAGYVFSKEKWMLSHFPGLSFGKIRISYGITGSDQIGDYSYLDYYSPTGYAYQGNSTLYPLNLFNPDYSWEKNTKKEFALELGFLKDRILFNVILYRNRSSNQLVGIPLPLITGFSSVQSNLQATVQNQGVEWELNSVNIKKGNWYWSTSVNFTIPQNKLISFPGLLSSAYASRYMIGKPLSIYKAFHNTGIDPSLGVYQYLSVTDQVL